ncbi:50S ribosomal protein L28 [Candidatus Saccharibacteria bacterium]|nr:50S ribosomal protein L28 [Candidatus Saccharibacteria bacterium]
MAICEITGKGKMYGHNVSFSQRHTRKVFKPNVTKRTLIINGQKIKCNVSTSALRTLKKKGLITDPKTAKAEKQAKKA